jgi:hypothetical protein
MAKMGGERPLPAYDD